VGFRILKYMYPNYPNVWKDWFGESLPKDDSYIIAFGNSEWGKQFQTLEDLSHNLEHCVRCSLFNTPDWNTSSGALSLFKNGERLFYKFGDSPETCYNDKQDFIKDPVGFCNSILNEIKSL
jgi:hypothetical protein